MDQDDKIEIVLFIGGGVVLWLAKTLETLFPQVLLNKILLVIGTFCWIVGTVLIVKEKYDGGAKNAHIMNINMFRYEYDAYVENLKIPDSAMRVNLLERNVHGSTSSIPQYSWISNGCMKLFPMAQYYIQNETSSNSRPYASDLKLRSVSIDSILYFEEIGELRKYTTISGGGTSLKGALLGYALADDVGAIIGSREPITTNVVSEDDRRVELIYKNQDDQIENLEFEHDAYDVFKRLMPLKELRRIINMNTVQCINDDDDEDEEIQEYQTVKERLEQLKELKEEGLITEKEFRVRKKEILDEI